MEDFEITINAFLFHSNKDIEIFPIKVTSLKYKLISAKLESERQKIIKYLKHLKSIGEIKSVSRPKNKKTQKNLNYLCKIKKEIKKTIDKLKTIYQ